MESVEVQDDFWFKVDKNIRYYGNQLNQLRRTVLWHLIPNKECQPVFIVGCSRAGTTLVYKTFSQSHQLGSLDRESHDLWSIRHPLNNRDWNSHQLTTADASEGDRRFISKYFFRYTGQRQFVDKNNQNGLSVPYLLKLFPNARFVYVKRHPGDNILSLINGWQRADEYATWSKTLPQKIAIESGVYRRWCFFLFEGWRNYVQAPITDVCAEQYRTINQAILEAKKLVPVSQWAEIRYEDILADPVASFADLFEQTNLVFDSHMRQHCAAVTNRPYNAFSKVGTDKWLCSPKQREIQLQLNRLSPLLTQMGYRPD